MPSHTAPAHPAASHVGIPAHCPAHAVHGSLTCQDVESLLVDTADSLENTRAANLGFQATIQGLLSEIADLQDQIRTSREAKPRHVA